MKKSNILKNLETVLKSNILFLDGALGTIIQGKIANHPQIDQKNIDHLTLTMPEMLYDIHWSYLKAGANIITTNTISSTKLVQRKYGLENKVYDLNFTAAQIAKKACENYKKKFSHLSYVAGSIGPSLEGLSSIKETTQQQKRFNEFIDNYTEQINALLDGGVDLLLCETFFDLLNLEAALIAIKNIQSVRNEKLPLIVSITLTNESETLYSGHSIAQFWDLVKTVEPLAIGLNCGDGVRLAKKPLEKLAAQSTSFISFYPNAGVPDPFIPSKGVESANFIASNIENYVDQGLINIIGGCCGTTPEFINLIVNKCKRKKPRFL